ncbi:nitroreductase family protein [Desulfopila inferna]|uniref:nitroreductase family protein n=1 Tax=Desulfopila inferna TaxID=468528 RepID=UPI001962E01D|nr:nitroreductase family protein [Desulfopila inferna]MBM9605126.1 nitroreductase family protein [Desulfopila inferna]
MDFSDLTGRRQSVRSYTDSPVENWKIDALIEAVRLAPSACNSQPWKLIIIEDQQKKNAVAQATYSKLVSFNKFAVQAPVIAILTIERTQMISQIGGHLKDREFPLIDIGIAAAHFCLQAADLGLGTCMVGWFDEDAVREIVGIPERKRIGLLITLGYSADETLRPKLRKPRDKMCSFNSYFTRG